MGGRLPRPAGDGENRVVRPRAGREGATMIWLYVFIGLALVVTGLRLFVRPPEDPPEDASDDDIRALALSGRRIDAIRWHRLLHGSDLHDAKAAVDAMVEGRG